MLVERNYCIICGNKDFEDCLSLDHRLIARCRHCGCRWAIRFDSEELSRHYREDYYSSPDDPRMSAWISRHMPVWREITNNLKRLSVSMGSLLDIGAGTGGFLLALREVFPSLHMSAIESSPEAREHLRKILTNVDFPALDVERLGECHISYDCISLLQCLEHVSDPLSLCSQIVSHLKTGGISLIAVPNRRSYQRFFRKPEKTQCYGNPTHLQFFDRPSIETLFKLAGFRKWQRIAALNQDRIWQPAAWLQFACRMAGVSTELRYVCWK